MHESAFPDSGPPRRVHTRLLARSLAPRVYEALQALGYSLSDEANPGETRAGLWLVDEARFAEVPDPVAAPNARILLLSSPGRNSSIDVRILGRATRPARLSAVYSLIQGALEDTPRKTPRIRTRLSARCLRAERRSIGAVLSLSEGGCLLRTGEALKKGAKLELQFALPEYGLVSTNAECRYVKRGDAGVEFDTPAADIQQSIARFVTVKLSEHPAPGPE